MRVQRAALRYDLYSSGKRTTTSAQVNDSRNLCLTNSISCILAPTANPIAV